MQRVSIPSRFCGPPKSANGGWTCGVLARHFGGGAQVTLRKPIPLDVDLELVEAPAGLQMLRGDELLAEAEPTALSSDVPSPVSWEEATDATHRFPWRDRHPYPTCFGCGPDRGDDALRLFPGEVFGRRVVAAPWTVPEDLCEQGQARPELLWAALDCPSWFGHAAFEAHQGLVLLGRLSATVRSRPEANARCVVIGYPKERVGRKIHCGSALYREDGEPLACAEALWIEVRQQ